MYKFLYFFRFSKLNCSLWWNHETTQKEWKRSFAETQFFSNIK